MKTNEIIKSVEDNYLGLWKYEDKGIEIILEITQGNLRISLNGTTENFGIRPLWVKETHFWLTNIYYITYADEKKLEFGKSNYPFLGSFEWEYTFQRI